MTQHRKRGDGCRALLAYFREIADGEGIARCSLRGAAKALGLDDRTVGRKIDFLVLSDCVEVETPGVFRLTGKDYQQRPNSLAPSSRPEAPSLAFGPDEDEEDDSIGVMPGAVFVSPTLGAEAIVHRIGISDDKARRRFPVSLARVRFGQSENSP